MRSKDQGYNPFPFTPNGIERANTVEPGRRTRPGSVKVTWLNPDGSTLDGSDSPVEAAVTIRPDLGLISFNANATLYMGIREGVRISLGFDVNRPKDWYFGVDDAWGSKVYQDADGHHVRCPELVNMLLESIDRAGAVRIPLGNHVVINGSPAWNLVTLAAKTIR